MCKLELFSGDTGLEDGSVDDEVNDDAEDDEVSSSDVQGLDLLVCSSFKRLCITKLLTEGSVEKITVLVKYFMALIFS
jgi:hypothetical protein